DKNGAAVRGLTRDDFVLIEDDKPQAIESFAFESVPVEAAPAEPPEPSEAAAPILRASPPTHAVPPTPAPDLAGRRLVVLLFDLSSMQPEHIEQAVDSARKYVRTRMSAADLVAIAS